MEENKQVRVDNWGVFFLQRLQLFFNKTDYCDLTLQFQGNVQLKVHRLVLNACTEYFDILERSDRLIDENVILMPEALQPEVVVPIINFMYTGMLEYPHSIYNRLCQAADLMQITVLTKLLDAQKPPVLNKPEKLMKPKAREIKSESFNAYSQVKKFTPKPVISDHPSPTFSSRKATGWKRKPVISSVNNSSFSSRSDSIHRSGDSACYDEAKPTRFEWPEDDLDLPNLDTMDVSGFGDISYNSKPLLREDDVKPIIVKTEIKKPSSKDTIHELQLDDKSNQDTTRNGVEKRKADTVLDNKSPKRIRIVESEKDTTISVIASDNSTNFDPTKIVSEILKKYPHLVKKKKNIKLKIVAKQTEKETPKSQISHVNPTVEKMKTQANVRKPVVKPEPSKPTLKDSVWTCKECVNCQGGPQEFMLYYLYRKHMTHVHDMKFDPRICKYCGIAFSKSDQQAYHLFTKHGIKPAGGQVFPSCPKCPYVALSNEVLQNHVNKHEKKEMQCACCKLAFVSADAISGHLQITGHMGKVTKNVYDCQYCTKSSQSSISLLSHIKSCHEMEGKRDGIVSLDEVDLEVGDDILDEIVEEQETMEEYMVPEAQKNKVKIISDVTVPVTKSNTTEETVTLDQTKSHVSVPTSIATSLGLLDIVVLDENQQFILHNQSQQTGNNQTEYILPQIDARNVTAEGLPSNDELVMVLTDQDYKDGHSGISTENSNIVVLYSHPADGQQGQFITSQGNLMVNSETGMLEIRNGAAIATTSANQIVMSAPADNHIETIEMIQREIDGGQDLKPGTFYEEPKPKVLEEQVPEPVHYVENTQVEATQEQPSAQKEVMEISEKQIEEGPKTEPEQTVVEQEVTAADDAPMLIDTAEEQTLNEGSVAETESTSKEEQVETSVLCKEPEPCAGDVKDTVPMEIEDTSLVEDTSLAEECSLMQKEEVSNSEHLSDVPPSELEETILSSETTDVVEQKDEEKPEDKELSVDEDFKQSSDGEKDLSMDIDETIIENNEETDEQPNLEENKDDPAKAENTTEMDSSVEESPPFEKEEERPYSPTDNPVDMECEAEPEAGMKQVEEPLNENSIEISQCEKDVDNQEERTSTQSSQVEEEDAEDKQSEGTKESTTMSILDDWEDTDSQQSDNKTKLMKKGAQETVHKLMDDWDEEEIEK